MRSYKLRGAYNLLMQLTPEENAAGVVCSSAGNHAQGFALACRSMGIHGRVYVPAKTPKQKRDRIRYHGGEFIELIVGGKTYDMAAAAALEDVARTGATLVPPYDDLRTMAGQGTIAVEMLDQLDAEPDLVIVPVGGGGCISGITTYLAERTTGTVGARASSPPAPRRWWPRWPTGAAGDARARRPVRRRRRGAPGGRAAVRGAGGRRATWCRSPRSTRARCAPRCSTCTRTRASSPSPRARCRWRRCWRPTSRRDRRWCA